MLGVVSASVPFSFVYSGNLSLNKKYVQQSLNRKRLSDLLQEVAGCSNKILSILQQLNSMVRLMKTIIINYYSCEIIIEK